MRNIASLLLLLCAYANVFANHIDAKTAQAVGYSYMMNSGKLNRAPVSNQLQLVYTFTVQDAGNNFAAASPYFYIFNVSHGKGFIIISADDDITPVLGYSNESLFDTSNIPINVASWFEGYKREIQFLFAKHSKAGTALKQQWDDLKNGRPQAITAKVKTVGELLQTRWNQLTYYNSLCPNGAPTGCVATAMAQIMKYWNYPARGTSSHSYSDGANGTLSARFDTTAYQWLQMTNTVGEPNSAVATLMYHAGVSVNMQYTPQESGAYVISAASPIQNCAEYALKTYFGYTGAYGIIRASYTQDQWLTAIKTELDASRPVIYAGYDVSGGHCFVADGYDENSLIHFNWGWSGAFDGYFYINALNPGGVGTGGGTGQYNSGHQAIIGIQPPAVAQTHKLLLNDYVVPAAATINYFDDVAVSASIINKGTGAFTGDLAAAIYDNANNFIGYVQTAGAFNLASNAAGSITFRSAGLLKLLPGSYKIGIYYRQTGGKWVLVPNNGKFVNLVPLKVVNLNQSIQLFSSITTLQGTTLTTGKLVTAKVNLTNTSAATIKATYLVALFNLDNTVAQTIGDFQDQNGLAPGAHFAQPVTLNPAVITVTPGTYLLTVLFQPQGFDGLYFIAGAGAYANPVKVTVLPPKPNLSKDTTIKICIGSTANLKKVYDTSGCTVQWGTANPANAGIGSYTVVVTNNYGLKDTAIITIRNYPAPVIQPLNRSGCNSVRYNGVTYTASTIHRDTLRNIAGCDSVYQVATITVHTTVPTIRSLYYSGCNSVLYNKITYTSSTVKRDTVKTKYGCDSIYIVATITVTKVTATRDTLNLSTCNSLVYGGKTYTASTVLRLTIKSVQGCDSIYKVVNIKITKIKLVTKAVAYSGCNSVAYNGTVYTISTIKRDTLRSKQGCDSVHIIATITVHKTAPTTQTYNFSGCNRVVYNKVAYTASTIKRDTIRTKFGCDSIYVVANISVTKVTPVADTINLSDCNSVPYKGITHTASVVIKETVPSTQGCDSVYRVVNIKVTKITPVTVTTPFVGCTSYVYKGITYTSSTTLRDTVRSRQDCDSIYKIVTITITGNNLAKPVVTKTGNTTFCLNDSLVLTTTAVGTYQWLRNNSDIKNATVKRYAVSLPGTYKLRLTNTTGCTVLSDSIVASVIQVPRPAITLMNDTLLSSANTGNQWFLNSKAIAGATANKYAPYYLGSYTVQAKTDACASPISDVYFYTASTFSKLGKAGNMQVLVYPNPAADVANLRINGTKGPVVATVTNVQGKIVWQQDKLTNKTYTLPLHGLAAGMYIVTIKDGQNIQTFKLVKGN